MERHPGLSVILTLGVFALSTWASVALAAPLTWSTADSISLSSPATNFTIATGSVADSLQVNATSVIITLSSYTGGTFTLTSASYDLTIASSSAGGTASLSCTSGVASVTLSQTTGQTNYTITPAASQCTPPSNNSGGSGGGGGSGSVGVSNQYGSPYTPGVGVITTSTQALASSTATSTLGASSTAALQAQLNLLLALYTSLLTKAKAKGITALGSSGSPHLFLKNLYLGTCNSDVTALQRFLAENPSIYPKGKVTGYFGALTLQAVERFQKKYGIAKAGGKGYGTVGPMTRTKLNGLIEEGATP